jgi:hypothetical protein
MENYETLTEGINALRTQGYTEDFNLRENCIECRAGAFKVFHDEFHVDKFFRFEDDTNPSDQSILYAISSEKHHLKGVLVNGYGIYSDTIANEMMDKLNVH